MHRSHVPSASSSSSSSHSSSGFGAEFGIDPFLLSIQPTLGSSSGSSSSSRTRANDYGHTNAIPSTSQISQHRTSIVPSTTYSSSSKPTMEVVVPWGNAQAIDSFSIPLKRQGPYQPGTPISPSLVECRECREKGGILNAGDRAVFPNDTMIDRGVGYQGINVCIDWPAYPDQMTMFTIPVMDSSGYRCGMLDLAYNLSVHILKFIGDCMKETERHPSRHPWRISKDWITFERLRVVGLELHASRAYYLVRFSCLMDGPA